MIQQNTATVKPRGARIPAAEDTTLPDGARAHSVEWDVFGPAPIPHDAQGKATVAPFSVLPSVADLDAGKTFECRLVKERFTSGWKKDWSAGPMLNLTYIARHGTSSGNSTITVCCQTEKPG
ncbi:MAG: hypothetical protein AAB676_07515 [Verrucomicrobiota bacterium]